MAASDSEKVTVLIVEDHPVSLDGLIGYIRTAPDIVIVGTADEGSEAVALVREFVPDVVIVDLFLAQSQLDGIEITRAIRELSPSTQVLVVTAYDDDALILGALGAGAMGYLLKTSTSADLLDAIRDVARRQPVLHPRVFDKLMSVLRPSHDDLQSGSPRAPQLTEREWDVVTLISQGCSNKDIAERLVISEKTVKVHVSNILQKLHLTNRVEVRYWVLSQSSSSDTT